MKCSIEVLYHLNCNHCSRWWSFGDIPVAIGQNLTCPHCGVTDVITEKKNGNGDDVAAIGWVKSPRRAEPIAFDLEGG